MPMAYHILNGDCLAHQLKETGIEGEMIICRECLIEGPIAVGSLESFWTLRAAFIEATYGVSPEQYHQNVVDECAKISTIPRNAEVCLWFEHDLFCQANMWFVMALFQAYTIDARVYIVYPVIPPGDDVWKGFGLSDSAALLQAYAERIPLSEDDLEVGISLWHAHATNNMQQLVELSRWVSTAFRYLPEVCQARADQLPDASGLNRPEKAVKELMMQAPDDFDAVLATFSKVEGIYGFGDVQVRNMFDRMRQEF